MMRKMRNGHIGEGGGVKRTPLEMQDEEDRQQVTTCNDREESLKDAYSTTDLFFDLEHVADERIRCARRMWRG